DIRVLAGIKNNGISATRTWWPFYKPIDLDTLVAAGSTLTLPMNFSYHSTVTFTWTEDFDSGIGISLVKSFGSDTTLKMADPSNSFEGRSMELGLTAPAQYAQVE